MDLGWGGEGGSVTANVSGVLHHCLAVRTPPRPLTLTFFSVNSTPTESEQHYEC